MLSHSSFVIMLRRFLLPHRVGPLNHFANWLSGVHSHFAKWLSGGAGHAEWEAAQRWRRTADSRLILTHRTERYVKACGACGRLLVSSIGWLKPLDPDDRTLYIYHLGWCTYYLCPNIKPTNHRAPRAQLAPPPSPAHVFRCPAPCRSHYEVVPSVVHISGSQITRASMGPPHHVIHRCAANAKCVREWTDVNPLCQW
jgi:hypothetical protein